MLLGLAGLGMTANVQAELLAAAAQYGVPSQVMLNVAQTESGGNQAAIGPMTSSGEQAVGVMQLMPSTAIGLGVNPYDEVDNINGGAMYLSQMYRQFGSWNLAVAAYNDGPGNIQQVLAGTKTLPTETANYVQKVLGVPFDPSGQSQGIAAVGGTNAGTLIVGTPTGSVVAPVGTGANATASVSLPLLLVAAGVVLLVAMD